MRSASSSSTHSGTAVDDLTTRARIRDVALSCFAREGFGASVRTIAAEAGVSPGLVIHHFGSKGKLRAECDDFASASIRSIKRESMVASANPMDFIAQLSRIDEYAPLLGYTIRSLQAGGEMARAFVERLADDAYEYIGEGVAAGTIIPSRDDRARARYLTTIGLGPLLVSLTLYPPTELSDLRAMIDKHLDQIALPALELFTEGLLTDTSVLDSYLAYRERERNPEDSEVRDSGDGRVPGTAKRGIGPGGSGCGTPGPSSQHVRKFPGTPGPQQPAASRRRE